MVVKLGVVVLILLVELVGILSGVYVIHRVTPPQVSIYAAPEKLQQTHYALEVAIKTLDFYEKYFNINYPLPKQGTQATLQWCSVALLSKAALLKKG